MRFLKMGTRLAVLGGLLVLAVMVIVACAQPGASIAPVPPTVTAFPPPPTDVPAPPPGPTPAALDFPLAAPTEVEAEEPVDDQTCVTCHTSEGALQTMATTEEEVEESLSEGEG
ncbi:MAG: hypothetical protein PVJ23_07680 [Anaerolineae bacterium]|jgi:hypothetical protein